MKLDSVQTLERMLGCNHKLEKSTLRNFNFGQYVYRKCFIAKSASNVWFVNCADARISEKLPKGLQAKTLKALTRKIDSHLNQLGPSVP